MHASARAYRAHVVITRPSYHPRLWLASVCFNMCPQVAWICHRRWLTNIWFLRDAEKEMLIDLASYLSARVFAPDERCPCGVMYIVHRGTAYWAGRVIHAGGVWGDDVLLQSASLRLDFPALAMTYLWVYVVDGNTLRSLASKYPETARALRDIEVCVCVCVCVCV